MCCSNMGNFMNPCYYNNCCRSYPSYNCYYTPNCCNNGCGSFGFGGFGGNGCGYNSSLGLIALFALLCR